MTQQPLEARNGHHLERRLIHSTDCRERAFETAWWEPNPPCDDGCRPHEWHQISSGRNTALGRWIPIGD